jgi:hypothetical protein
MCRESVGNGAKRVPIAGESVVAMGGKVYHRCPASRDNGAVRASRQRATHTD